jgi:parvulin-like peptidyl-prolyl isomerase
VDGDMGYVERGDLPLEMEGEIFRTAFNANGKNISNIVRSQDGFHIFKRERYRRRHLLRLKEARPKIKKILVTQKWDAAYLRWLAKLKKNAKISIDQAMLVSEEGF